jgi:hypothetical protein
MYVYWNHEYAWVGVHTQLYGNDRNAKRYNDELHRNDPSFQEKQDELAAKELAAKAFRATLDDRTSGSLEPQGNDKTDVQELGRPYEGNDDEEDNGCDPCVRLVQCLCCFCHSKSATQTKTPLLAD